MTLHSVCVRVMDVLLLSFEARCMLDGIRRRLKKTGSSLSVALSVSPSILNSWRVREKERERNVEGEKDRKIDGERETDGGIFRERQSAV